jgi:hypothetical protein
MRDEAKRAGVQPCFSQHIVSGAWASDYSACGKFFGNWRHATRLCNQTIMKAPLAILFTIGLFIVAYLGSAFLNFDLITIMVLGTALWAAIDSSRLQLKRYKSGISYGPVVLFIACALLWIIGFPWYLSVRYRIKAGTAVLKDATPSIVVQPV